MKICNLASGSKGNATYIESTQAKILIDCGLSYLELQKRLGLLNRSISDIDAILITHEHIDHIKGLDMVCKKHNVLVFSYEDEWAILQSKCPNIELAQQRAFGNLPFYFNDLYITPIKVSHDSHTCFGYSVCCDNKKFSILTDLGHTNSGILSEAKNSTLLLIEANHDVPMLMQNPHYPLQLKHRILSKKGHLSNESCANAILELYASGIKQVLLGHLSEENNTPLVAYNSVCSVLAEHGIQEGINIKIDVTWQNKPTPIFNLV